MEIVLLLFQVESFYFFFLPNCPVKSPVQYWIEVMRASSLVLFLILEGKIQSVIIKYDGNYRIFIDALCQVKEVSFFSSFVEYLCTLSFNSGVFNNQIIKFICNSWHLSQYKPALAYYCKVYNFTHFNMLFSTLANEASHIADWMSANVVIILSAFRKRLNKNINFHNRNQLPHTFLKAHNILS